MGEIGSSGSSLESHAAIMRMRRRRDVVFRESLPASQVDPVEVMKPLRYACAASRIITITEQP
jgi:hypothetical protein